MKIQLVSDLHMEFAPITITNAGADVLILSGDICVADYFTRSEASPLREKALLWLEWFEDTCEQFERVYYVLGNHEHYKGRFYETSLILQNALGHIRNLVILDNAIDRWGGLTWFGTTLWTDFDHDNFKAMCVREGMNDYKLIQGKDYRKLSTAETAYYNKQATNAIQDLRPDVVIGHHAPSWRSIAPEYLYGSYANLNAGYASHLDKLVEFSGAKLWTHGHVHSSWDYEIGATRVVANPRGYAHASNPHKSENKDFNPKLILEI